MKYNYYMNFVSKQILIDNKLVFIRFWIKLSQLFVKNTGGLKLFVMTVLSNITLSVSTKEIRT